MARRLPKALSMAVTLMTLLLASAVAQAQETALREYETLRGVKSYWVIAEVEETARSFGVSDLSIKNAAESTLRAYGVASVDSTEFAREPDSVSLAVAVDALDTGRGLAVYTIRASVHQVAAPLRRPLMNIVATTWTRMVFGICSPSTLSTKMTPAVRDLVSQLVTEHRLANP